MGSSSSQTPTQTSSTTAEPWQGVQPSLLSLYGATQGTYASDVGNQPYIGNTLAGIDPAFSQGFQGNLNVAQRDLGGSAGLQAARNLGLQDIQDARTKENPYLQAMLDTSNRRISDRVNASMSGAGRYGSGQHTDAMVRALAESANPILAEDYQQRQQRAGQWAQLMPTLDQAQYAPGDIAMGLGGFNMDRAQQALNAQIRQYEAQQARPWEQLAKYANVLQGAGGLGGTKSTLSTQPAVPTSNRIFGGALAGAGLGSTFGPVGAGAGALGGGLLGLMG